MILVPIKNLRDAKQRLSPFLDSNARFELANAMAEDVLEALGLWRNRPEVGVVTTDPFAIELARKFNFEIITDGNISETDAIETATEVCRQRGAESTLVIPADIPLIEAWELEAILQAAPEEGSVLVPAGDGRGTNAAFRRPANLFPLRFGNDSFRPHFAAAQASGKRCVTLALPGIARDVDNPSDLQGLANVPGETRAQHLIRQWNLDDRRLAANE
jgi:2-phospho-L-lactate/phosphoenolpyruvate guanylyltransferase